MSTQEKVRGQVKLRPVYVPVSLHSRAKSKTSMKGVSLKSVVVELLEEYLKQK